MNDLSFIVKQLIGGQPSVEQRLKWAADNFRFRISQAVDRLRTGKTTLPEFQQFGRDELRDTYYMIAEIGKGAPLTPKEMAQVRVTLREQVGYWDNFCQAIADQRKEMADKGLKGDELEEAFNNLYDKFDRRAQSYAGAIEAQGEEWAMAGAYENGQWFRWVRSPVESCPTCLKRDGGVWQMKDGRLPFYPRDGQSECLYNCLCHWEPISRFAALALRALGKLKQVFRRKSFDEIADEWLEKGGPGSGHWGHAGRPGKRGGSISGQAAMSIKTGRTAAVRRRGAKVTAQMRQQEVSPIGEKRYKEYEGNLGNTSHRLMTRTWWGDDITPDEFDPGAEYVHIEGCVDHARNLLKDPETKRLINVLDEGGDTMIANAERHITTNIVFTTNKEDEGMGSGGTGSAKVFWRPYTASEKYAYSKEDAWRGRFYETEPVYVLMHELHHAFGSHTELDKVSDFMSLDYHMANGNKINPTNADGKLTSLFFGARRRPTGDALSRKWAYDNRRIMRALVERHPRAMKEWAARFGEPYGWSADDVLSEIRKMKTKVTGAEPWRSPLSPEREWLEELK